VRCAVTGAVHVPSMTHHLPVTPAQIEGVAVGAAEAGAPIVHLHARNSNNCAPTTDPEVYARFIPEIASRTDAIINITTGGGHGISPEGRTAAVRRFRPELCSMNMGSMSCGMLPAARRITSYKNDWEEPYLEMTRDYIVRNTFQDIETLVRAFGDDGTRFEFECYDVGHLHTLAIFSTRASCVRRCSSRPCLATLGEIAAHPEHVMQMKTTADQLFGDACELSMLTGGASSDGAGHAGSDLGHARPHRSRGQHLPRAGNPSREQWSAGGEDRSHPARALVRDRDSTTSEPSCSSRHGQDRLGGRYPGSEPSRGHGRRSAAPTSSA
jgi:uncharacterized protein (DUF849 family)